jgi:uncharacterized membrane protein YbhN (UPF0104 family)
VFKSTNYIQHFQVLIGLFALSVAVYFLLHSDLEWKSLKIDAWLYSFPIIAMSFINLFFEYQKWNLLLKSNQIERDRKQTILSLSRGALSNFFIPVFVGNLPGRLIEIEKEKRMDVSIGILWSNFSQYLSTLLFGCIGLIFCQEYFTKYTASSIYLVILMPIMLVISFLFYFGKLNRFRCIKIKSNYYKHLSTDIKWKLFQFSAVRYLVFCFQYYFMLLLFGPVSVNVLFFIFLMYLVVTIIPTFILGKIGIREAVAVFVLGSFIPNNSIIIASSIIIWFLNNVLSFLPAVLFKVRS